MNRWLPPLLIIATGLCMSISAWLMSNVYNEYGRLASGLIYLRTGDYSSFRVNPPLVNLIGAIPAQLAGATHATRADLGIRSFARDEYKAGGFFVEKNQNHRTLLYLGRFCCIALVLMGLWGCFRFAQAFFGHSAGYLFLGLGLLSPYILGFGALIVPDVPSALLGAVSVYCLWRWLRSPDFGNAFIAGLLLGIAELCKFTLLIFYPLYVIIWLIYRIPTKKADERPGSKASSFFRQFQQLVFLFAVSLLIINMGYFFEGTGKQLRSFQFQTTLFTGYKTLEDIPSGGANRFSGSGNAVETVLGYLPMPLPKNFIQGIDTQRFDFENGLPSYLRGEWSKHGWWYYYLYALLLKTPLGTLLLFLLAIICSLLLKGYNNNWRDELVILLPGVVLLAFVSSQTGFSIHSRYIIPVLPFFFVWMSKVGRAFSPEMKVSAPKSSRLVRWLTLICLVWSTGTSLWYYPHSIAYFNELAAIIPTPEDHNYPQLQDQPASVSQKIRRFLDIGALNGPRHLLDSNIDWGQDLFGLERWCKAHPEVQEIGIITTGDYPTELTTIPSTKEPPSQTLSDKTNLEGLADPPTLQPGWYAVDVDCLYDKEKQYRYFLKYKPEAIIGYTIYIYHIPPAD